MGKRGSAGLATGGHLHFSMQIDGVQVNPIEWWDEHWNSKSWSMFRSRECSRNAGSG